MVGSWFSTAAVLWPESLRISGAVYIVGRTRTPQIPLPGPSPKQEEDLRKAHQILKYAEFAINSLRITLPAEINVIVVINAMRDIGIQGEENLLLSPRPADRTA